jgi:hypothetical protein
MPWPEPDDAQAWVDLSEDEYREIWDRVYATFDFTPSVKAERWPSFREPSNSVTWDLRPVFADFANSYERTELETAKLLLDALDLVRAEDDFVYALDWQHPGYRFEPARARPPERIDSWLVPAIPDGDYYVFVACDLRFGWLSHPWEQSVCVYGDLLPALQPALVHLGWPILRSGGVESATSFGPVAD